MTWDTGACIGLHVLKISRNLHYEVITNVICKYVWAWVIFMIQALLLCFPSFLPFRTKSLWTPWNIFTGVSTLALCNLLPNTYGLNNDRIYNRRRKVNTLSKKIKASNSFKSLNIFCVASCRYFSLQRIPNEFHLHLQFLSTIMFCCKLAAKRSNHWINMHKTSYICGQLLWCGFNDQNIVSLFLFKFFLVF